MVHGQLTLRPRGMLLCCKKKANQVWENLYKPSLNQRIVLLVKNASGKYYICVFWFLSLEMSLGNYFSVPL